MRKVEVKPYTVEWEFMFEEEKKKIREIFKDELVDVYHIGSTSVKGMMAKPIIDLMPVVKEINKVDDFNKAMKAISYHPKGENGITGRRYFEKGGDVRTHHVHIYEVGDEQIERHVAFRDYLRVHSKERMEYGKLKVELAERYPFNINAYINGKKEVVSKIESKAINWNRQENR
ncbi:GrpB family protein [Halobacillus mangrovi]|uniref:GrpB family protein n=1 Tax=Halobacillus mangrovi TaxID=402384 RepID=UPI003D95BCF6